MKLTSKPPPSAGSRRWATQCSPAPGEPSAERQSFSDVVLVERLRAAIRQLNPGIPEEACEGALRRLLRLATPSLLQTNRAFHRLLREGVPVEYPRPDGSLAGDHVRLVDFTTASANDWLVVNQFAVSDEQHSRRPDLVVFLNGLPLGLLEIKNAAAADATIWSAYAQLQTYKAEIPSLLQCNALLVVSDGLQARFGSLTANQEWFKVWRSVDGHTDAPATELELDTLIRGVFESQRFLDLLQHFIVFEEDPDSGALHKIIAGYHQFHAVNAAVLETVRASGLGFASRCRGGMPGDRRAGVVWHTQGSGKSFSMLFYAACIVRHPAMQNPTLVVLTDRNDLDDQLFGQFQRCADLLAQTPVQAALAKQPRGSGKTPEQIDAAIRQLVSKAITADGEVIDVFSAAGLPKPDISILSDQFLAEVRGLKHKNAVNSYHNRAITTVELIEELIAIAKEIDAASKRGEALGRNDDEIAFYDALATNESAVQAMGDAKLKLIAAELISQVKKSVSIDWTLRESARARIRVMVKCIPSKYGYPPDLQAEAVKTVLAQAELLCAQWL